MLGIECLDELKLHSGFFPPFLVLNSYQLLQSMRYEFRSSVVHLQEWETQPHTHLNANFNWHSLHLLICWVTVRNECGVPGSLLKLVTKGINTDNHLNMELVTLISCKSFPKVFVLIPITTVNCPSSTIVLQGQVQQLRSLLSYDFLPYPERHNTKTFTWEE